MSKRMKKGTLVTIILTTLLVITLGILTSYPMISCTLDLPEAYGQAIESQAAGVYSRKLPLVPVCVTVDSFSEDTVYYTIHYFPFGTVGMAYNESDGYHIEKPLAPGAYTSF